MDLGCLSIGRIFACIGEGGLVPPQTLDHGRCYFSKSNQHPGTYYIPRYKITTEFITFTVRQGHGIEMCLLRSIIQSYSLGPTMDPTVKIGYANLITLFIYLQSQNLFSLSVIVKIGLTVFLHNSSFYATAKVLCFRLYNAFMARHRQKCPFLCGRLHPRVMHVP